MSAGYINLLATRIDERYELRGSKHPIDDNIYILILQVRVDDYTTAEHILLGKFLDIFEYFGNGIFEGNPDVMCDYIMAHRHSHYEWSAPKNETSGEHKSAIINDQHIIAQPVQKPTSQPTNETRPITNEDIARATDWAEKFITASVASAAGYIRSIISSNVPRDDKK